MTEQLDEVSTTRALESTPAAGRAAPHVGPPASTEARAGRSAPADHHGGRTELVGAIDAMTGNAVLHHLLFASTPGETFVVDMAMVDAIDAAGLEILQTARRQSRMIGGDLILAGVPARFQEFLADFITEDDLAVTDHELAGH